MPLPAVGWREGRCHFYPQHRRQCVCLQWSCLWRRYWPSVSHLNRSVDQNHYLALSKSHCLVDLKGLNMCCMCRDGFAPVPWLYSYSLCSVLCLHSIHDWERGERRRASPARSAWTSTSIGTTSTCEASVWRLSGHCELNIDFLRINNAPVFLYIHGGGWVAGHRGFHSIPLLYDVRTMTLPQRVSFQSLLCHGHQVARAGWLVVTINYRLAPAARAYPDQLIDCKKGLNGAVQWISYLTNYCSGGVGARACKGIWSER